MSYARTTRDPPTVPPAAYMVVSWQPSRTCLLRSKRNGSHGTAINAAINLQVSVFAAIDDQLLTISSSFVPSRQISA